MRRNENEVLDIIKNYKLIIADINEIDFKIQELDADDNISMDERSINLGTKLSKTNNIQSNIEKAYERKEELKLKQEKMCRQLKRIDNALTILTEEERHIMQTIHIEHRRYYVVQDRLNFSYQRIKQLEKQAIEKMKPYVLG